MASTTARTTNIIAVCPQNDLDAIRLNIRPFPHGMRFPTPSRPKAPRTCTHKIAIGDSEVSTSAVVHFADSSRIYPEVREVPEPDSCTTAFDHLVGVGEHLIRHIVD